MVAAVVTLVETKAFLNITNSASDGELPFYISAATSMWAQRGGPVGEQTVTDEWFDGGTPSVVVRHVPLASVQSVVESIGATGYTLTAADPGTASGAYSYSVDLNTGTFVRRVNGTAVPFASGIKNVHVSYTSGYTTVPDDIKLAVMLLTKHMWETQRGIGRRPGTGGNDEYQPKEGYSWPHRVEEILWAYVGPGLA